MSNPHTSAVAGEGIDLIGGGGTSSSGVASIGPHGCRTGSSALRISVGAHQGLVTSSHALASMAGNRILCQGGNAFDATVAIMATLNVVEPMSSSIAGNGFLTFYNAKAKTNQVQALNMVGASPHKVDPTTITQQELAQGPKAAVVPGVFGGVCDLLTKLGTCTLQETFQTAIHYASQGHPIGEAMLAAIRAEQQTLQAYPTSAKVFCQPTPTQVGQLVTNPDLAKTFQTLVDAETNALANGFSREQSIQAACDCFYQGTIAQQCIQWFDQHDGLLTLDDFQYHRSNHTKRWDKPLHTNYKGYDVYTTGHTSRGGVETLMNLNVLEQLDILSSKSKSNTHQEEPQKDPQYNAPLLHNMMETIKIVKSCIYHYMGDPQFTKTPLDQMLSKEYAKSIADMIYANQQALKDTPLDIPAFPKNSNNTHTDTDNKDTDTTPSSSSRFTEEYYDSPDTTSFSVVDQWGNCVCCTITIGEGFGNRCVVGDTGLLFNNGMRIGSTCPYPDHINALQPRKVALINNAPVLVFRDGQFQMSVGTPGGEMIGQVQTQTLVNLIDYRMSPQEAIEYPRFKIMATPNFYKAQSPYVMKLEHRIPQETLEELQERFGHDHLDYVGPYSICAVQGIVHGSFYASSPPSSSSSSPSSDEEMEETEEKKDTDDLDNDNVPQYGYAAGADPRGGYYAVGF